ncbi:MAG: cell division protein FtsZ [Elusimicrobia bacterium]|nr:cell division protein FtsZ [Elusimicrobiota bacterium]
MSQTRIKITQEFSEQPAVIKVVGSGGGGGNVINRMVDVGIRHVEFIAINTDSQDLRRSRAHVKIQIGEKLSKGLGVGGNPANGRKAAEESVDVLREVVHGADMVFVIAGMGGGTGTGTAPVVARLAKDMGALTVGVVSRPFEFEGRIRGQQAENGIREMREIVDTLIVIPNEKLFNVIDQNTTIPQAYLVADDASRQAVQAITDVITTSGEINVDFADVRAIMTNSGEALMGIGIADGQDRAIDAAKAAIHSPMLENMSIEGAKGLLVNITASRSVVFLEIKKAMEFIQGAVSPDANVFFGQAYDEDLESRIKVTVIATGFPQHNGKAGHFPRVQAASLRRAALGELSSRPISAFRPSLSELRPVGSGETPLGHDSGTASAQDLLSRPAYLRSSTRKLK